ncbi:MAG: hypothetical protein ACYDBH_16380 [Acidobacteriaceae bacterium]
MNLSMLTDVPMIPSDPAGGNDGEKRRFEPVERLNGSTCPNDIESSAGTMFDRNGDAQRTFEPPFAGTTPSVSANSTPLQIWEGTVLEIDRDAGVMQVLLDAKIGQMPRHTGEIELEWVDDQDRDLVVPGAVFYLTLFKRIKPSVENAQELRFRRRPSWSAAQLKQVENDAAALLSKIKTSRTA